MSRIVQWMDRKLYPGYESRWDDQLLREEILKILQKDYTILDLGAGIGIVPLMDFRKRAARICGIDPDERVLENPYLDEAKVAVGESIPYPDTTFDLVFSDNVLEHLPDPEIVFHEVARVLKPGGKFLAKTPNRRHYVSLISRVSPHWFHQWINRLRGRASGDTFPTRYRANTPKQIIRHAERTGLRVHTVRLIEGRPEYMRMTALTYFWGWLYERLVNGLPFLGKFRVLLIAILEKPNE